MTDEWKLTDFEWAETVFIPAGDDQPACWKTLSDLNVGEYARYAKARSAAAALQMNRAERYGALVEKAALAGVLSRDEIAELNRLNMTLEAEQREQDRRRAAIDSDLAAGRYKVMWRREP